MTKLNQNNTIITDEQLKKIYTINRLLPIGFISFAVGLIIVFSLQLPIAELTISEYIKIILIACCSSVSIIVSPLLFILVIINIRIISKKADTVYPSYQSDHLLWLKDTFYYCLASCLILLLGGITVILTLYFKVLVIPMDFLAFLAYSNLVIFVLTMTWFFYRIIKGNSRLDKKISP